MLVSVEEMRSDVVWAMQTRYQGDVDTMFLQGITGHPLDPSQTPECPRLSSKGTTCKTLFDCTVPFRLKEHFVRPQFKELDANLWEPSLFGKAAA